MNYTLSEDGTIVVIKEGCKKIPTRAFYNNTKILKVIIPKSVLKIGKKAFDEIIGKLGIIKKI